jgi:activator of HSP90 ATPase
MKTFKKTFKINAEPSDVYSALTNPFTIELWSGYPAEMSTEPGSEFSLWEGDIAGKNIEFVQDKKVVQEWFFGEQKVQSQYLPIERIHRLRLSIQIFLMKSLAISQKGGRSTI